jgi:hypothetical protein
MIKETPYSRSRRSFTPRKNMLTPTPTKTKPAKPKHMDSQLDFIPVENTASLATQDSQLMTEHQKEVREEQARTAEMFPELTVGVSRKPKKTMKLGSESPSSKRQALIASWTPEPADTVAGKIPDPSVSFVAESQMDPPPAPRSVSGTGEDARWDSKEESSEPADIKDVPMADCDDYSQDGQPKDAILSSDIPSDDEPSADNFVDAPDRFITSENSAEEKSVPDDDVSPLKDISEIAIAIPPVKNSEEYAQVDDSPPSPHGPEAQIIAEVLSATGTPSTRNNKRRSKKRKRESLIQQDDATLFASPASPEMLDTIVIAADTNPQASPHRNVSIESERPAKRARGKDIDATPVRVSTRKNKGVKATPRGASSMLKDPNGTYGKFCPGIIDIRMHAKMAQSRAVYHFNTHPASFHAPDKESKGVSGEDTEKALG